MLVVEEGVAVVIEDNKLVAVFFADFFPELAYTSLPALFFELILLIHPCLKGCG